MPPTASLLADCCGPDLMQVARRPVVPAHGPHADKLGEGPRLHLVHHISAMDFGRDFAGPDFSGNLLVHGRQAEIIGDRQQGTQLNQNSLNHISVGEDFAYTIFHRLIDPTSHRMIVCARSSSIERIDGFHFAR
jgi:hypothetical protein